MKSLKIARLGFRANDGLFEYADHPKFWTDIVPHYFSDKKTGFTTQLFLTLEKYLKVYTKKFDKVYYVLTTSSGGYDPSGNLIGLSKLLNDSKVDIAVQPFAMDDNIVKDRVDFCYPFKMYYSSFMTSKPKYKPEVFGIFQTISSTVWAVIAAVVILMMLVFYITLKYKYSFKKIAFEVFTVLMGQSSSITPTSYAEKILVYSWVIGTMFLCLAYNSVFLSFLAFPPVVKIKTMRDLATAVEKGEYHAMTNIHQGTSHWLANSTEKHFRVIGEHILKNNFDYFDGRDIFVRNSSEKNIAFIVDTEILGQFSGEYYISEERFFETLAAMRVRKGFCCKQLLNTFVHRILASGIYSKYSNHYYFLWTLPALLEDSNKYTTKRKLTLTDVAPAFIFLVSGYILSFAFFIRELLSGRKKLILFKENSRNKSHCFYRRRRSS